LNCQYRFVVAPSATRWARRRVWFTRWIRHGYTIRQLCEQSGLSAWKMRQVIRYWLDHPPTSHRDLSGHRHVVVDGTFLDGRRTGLVVFIDGTTNAVVAGIFGLKEGERAMLDVCRQLERRGLCPISATIDGNPQLERMLRTVWPRIVIQRCLVHIHWQGQRWCRANPKRIDAQRLRELFGRVLHVRSDADRKRFVREWNAWNRQYGPPLLAARRRQWVQSDLKAARSMLLKALPNMFQSIACPGIPTTTNAAEGFFGRLKQNYARHRGLARHRRKAYFDWYFRLCR
jgi:hypothetical protein